MNRWLYATILSLSCGLLVACSGASGGALPSGRPTRTAVPATRLELIGTMAQRYIYHYGFPKRQPPLTVKTKITQHISITSGPAPEGYPAGSNQVVLIQETDETKPAKYESTTTAYVAQQQTQDLLYAFSTQISAPGAQSSTSRTTYASPRVMVRNGVRAWSNSPARKIDEAFSDGHVEDRTIATNGTYIEDGTALNYAGTLTKTKLLDRSSGAGLYQGGFRRCSPDTRFTFSEPAGTPAKITYAEKSYDSYYCAQAPETVPAWFEANPTFYDEADSSRRTKIPSTCDAKDRGTVTDVRSRSRFLDTIIGYLEETQSDTYTGSRGIQCVVYSDTTLIYYDWQGDTTDEVLVSADAKPVAEVTTQEVLTARNGGPALPSIAAVALGRHFLALMEPQRERLRTAMIHHLLMHARGGIR